MHLSLMSGLGFHLPQKTDSLPDKRGAIRAHIVEHPPPVGKVARPEL